ncbi:hypothetical protein BGZ94_004869 [Podila epigama]|nr:hypothetical protein BGZ94_004869 [Podila epigama]
MPLLDRVLFPASRRKPPFRKQQASSQPIPTHHIHSLDQQLDPAFLRHRRSAHTLRSSCNSTPNPNRALPPCLQSLFTRSQTVHATPATISDLYPLFRYLLVSRSYLKRPQHNRSKASCNESNCHRTVSGLRGSWNIKNTRHTSARHLNGPCPPNSHYHHYSYPHHQHYSYSHNQHYSSVSHSAFRLFNQPQAESLLVPCSRTRAIAPSRRILTGSSASNHLRSLHSFIPNSSIQQEHGTGFDEDHQAHVPTPENSHHPLAAAYPNEVESQELRDTIKNWVLSQITEARDLFSNQMYTHSLKVAQNARQHPYMAAIDSLSQQGTSVMAIHYHLQDLRIIEYCCNIASLQETGSSGMAMVEMMQQLNDSVLSFAGNARSSVKAEFRTSFNLNQDPLVNHTLAVMSKAWKDLDRDMDSHSPSRSGLQSDFSPAHSTFATAAFPFIQVLLGRNLFPGTTVESRQLVLDLLLLSRKHHKAMEWIWLWNRRDRADWMAHWGKSDVKHNLTSLFMHSKRPDLILDLFRLVHGNTGESHQWLRLLFVSLDSLQQHQNVASSRTLAHIFFLSDLDTRAYLLKRKYYKNDARKRADIQLQWLETLQDPALSIQVEENTLEHHLWRDMAMIGVMAREIIPEDITHFVETFVTPLIDPTNSLRYALSGERVDDGARDEYTDSLTRFLERKASKSSKSSNGDKDGSSSALRGSLSEDLFLEPQSVNESAPLLLKKVVQNTMALFRSESGAYHIDAITIYRTLLQDVAHQCFLRRGHLGLVSHITELLFRAEHPEHIWAKTLQAVDQGWSGHSSHSSIADVEKLRHSSQNNRAKEGWSDFSSHNRSVIVGEPGSEQLKALPGVRDFIRRVIRPDLARMIAKSALLADPSVHYRRGQLSKWYMAMADSSLLCRDMAKVLNHGTKLKPTSRAYDKAFWTLLQEQEYDLAASLHIHVHDLTTSVSGICRTIDVASTDFDPTKLPPAPAPHMLGRLVAALATSERGVQDLELAQRIVDRHVEIEKAIAALPKRMNIEGRNVAIETAVSDSQRHTDKVDGIIPRPKVIDIQTITQLVGGWSRRAEFSKARAAVDLMWSFGITPSMIFYNTLLQSLVDLTPIVRPGRRTVGGGKHKGMREMGRELMVKDMLRWAQQREEDGRPQSGRLPKFGASSIDQGWDLFHEVVSRASDRHYSLPGMLKYDHGVDGPLLLRELMMRPVNARRKGGDFDRFGELFRPCASSSLAFPSSSPSSPDRHVNMEQNSPRDGEFRPDAYTFAILLGAFAKRGEIGAISELFVQMGRQGLEPDVVIINILVNAFVKRGDFKAVERVVLEAKNRNMDLGLHLTNTVLNSLVEMDVPADRIRHVLKRVALLNSRRFDDSEEVAGGASWLGTRLSSTLGHSKGEEEEEADLPLDSVTYTTLVKYHTRRNDLFAAQEVFETMIGSGFVPGPAVYSLLLATCIRLQDVSSGLDIIRAMRTQSRLYPDAKAWKGLIRCAIEVEQSERMENRRQYARLRANMGSSSSSMRSSTGRSFAADASPATLSEPRSEEATRKAAYIRDAGPVMAVLAELKHVVGELNRTRRSSVSLVPLLMNDRDQDQDQDQDKKATLSASQGSMLCQKMASKELGKEYLLRVFTGAWISHPKSTLKKDERHDEIDMISHAEVKGRNGLLRRLVDHFLQSHEMDEVDRPLYGKEDAIARGMRAVWLIRFLESNEIWLGRQWKWIVVGTRVQELTGDDPRDVRLRLKRKPVFGPDER